MPYDAESLLNQKQRSRTVNCTKNSKIHEIKAMKIVIGAFFFIGIVFIAAVSNKFDVTINDIVTYEGLWVSVYGVFITLVQIMKVKKTTEATDLAIKDTRAKMDLILSVAEVSKHVVNLRFIKECVTNNKMELARLRLGDVKDFMSKIGYIEDLRYDKSSYKRLINSLELNINSLEQEINQTQKVDKNVFAKDIESVATFLIEVENKLKSQKI